MSSHENAIKHRKGAELAPLMAEEQLQAIEARADAATPGPWSFVAGTRHIDAGEHGLVCRIYPRSGESKRSDGEFVAHARADVSVLVAEVRRLRRGLAEVAAAHEVTRAERDRLRQHIAVLICL